MKIKKQFLSIFSLTLFLFTAAPALAENISVSPMFIDYVTEARDIKQEVIKIKNHGGSPVRMYASVHEISLGSDGEIKEFVTPAMTDRTTSVTVVKLRYLLRYILIQMPLLESTKCI